MDGYIQQPPPSAKGISSNGIIVGVDAGPYHGWTWANGNYTTSDIFGFLEGISDDGSVILSNIGGPGGSFGLIVNSVVQSIPLYPGSSNTSASDISMDGSVIVGDTREGTAWFYQNGSYVSPIMPSGYIARSATAVSSDGSVIAGSAHASSSQTYAVRWVNGIPEILPSPANIDYAGPREISGDGSTLVGAGYIVEDNIVTQKYPVMWRNGTVQVLPMLPISTSAVATAVSFDGSLVFGDFLDEFNNGIGAFVWDEINGTRLLKDFLEDDFGLNLSGWELLSVSATDASSNIITGYGINPQGQDALWIATIPEPATLGLLAFGGLLLGRKK